MQAIPIETDVVAAPPTVAELDAQIAAAGAELATLDEAAKALEAEAAKANVVFESEPTEQSATTKLVAEQRAKNAKRLAFKHKEGVIVPLQVRRQQILESVERDKHRAVMDGSRVALIATAMREAAAAFAASWDASIAQLATVLDERHGAAPRATALGVRFERLSFEGVIARLSDELNTVLTNPKLEPHKSSGRVIFGDTGTTLPVVNFSMHRPADVPGYVRHK